jgi:hypothetical protein
MKIFCSLKSRLSKRRPKDTSLRLSKNNSKPNLYRILKSTETNADMVDKIAFQSIGGVEGVYLPSKEKFKYGTLVTDYGIFPAETSKQVRRAFSRFAGHHISESRGSKRLRFLTWLIGIEEPPYYSLDLRSIHQEFPEWIKNDNWFYLQGIIAERSNESVLLKMQRNYWQENTTEQIEASINYLQIKNCPNSVRKSQFWHFKASFDNGFLSCFESERLADASLTKKILKSWQTDPASTSDYKEILHK